MSACVSVRACVCVCGPKRTKLPEAERDDFRHYAESSIKKNKRGGGETAHIMGADGHFESYAILQSVPLAGSVHSSHSPQTKLLSASLHCSDFPLTRSRSFLTLREGEASKTTLN